MQNRYYVLNTLNKMHPLPINLKLKTIFHLNNFHLPD
jgi:hypothetical protein